MAAGFFIDFSQIFPLKFPAIICLQVELTVIELLQITFVKLTVDCALGNNLLALPADSALARLLSKAEVRLLDMPLEAVVCVQHGLMTQQDYPIAPIAADVDGLQVGDAYWLRADPVHLLLQRDSFSLSDPVPLQVSREHAEQLIASLNQHFSQDGMTFFIGSSGAWYLRLDQIPDIQTTLPSVALDRNIYGFMPQGAAASVWLSYMNEVQMLLHDHPINALRESSHQAAINSVWFSGGGVMPLSRQSGHGVDLVVADGLLYRGLAKWSRLTLRPSGEPLAKLLLQLATHNRVRLELPGQHISDDAAFNALWDGLKNGQIKQLSMNLGCYEKTLAATVKPMDIYRFWRKRKPIGAYLK